MSYAWKSILENAIIGKVVTALVDEGFRLEMSDQDGGGLFVYAAKDGGSRPVGGYDYWVRLVPGNGADVIADHTKNLKVEQAAPDLLEALKIARKCIAYCRSAHKDVQSGGGIPVELFIDEAIAKAGG